MQTIGYKLKKINAAAAFLVILSLCGHAGTMCVSLWTGWYNFLIAKTCAYITVFLLAFHVLFVLILFFFVHDGANLKYKKENKATILQRASAIVMLVLLYVHTISYSGAATGEILTLGQTVFYCLTELLFFASVMTHVAVSFSKGLITLGLVSSAETIHKIDIAAYIICAVAMAAATGGMLHFYLG